MKKLLFLLLISALAASLFVSCGKTDDKLPADDDAIEIYKVENLEKYVFVDMQSQDSIASDVIADLRGSIREATGLTLKTSAAYQKNDYEILVGTTNRQESIDASKDLKYFDYSIKMINNKIVIAAGSDEALLSAAEFFKSEFLYPEGKSLYLPTEYNYIHNYSVEKLSVDGVDIKEFKILNQSFLEEEAIALALRSAFEFDFTVTEEAVEGEHYIILDAGSYAYEDYSITVEDGNIRIYGSDRSISTALDAFAGEFLEGLGKKEYNLTSADKLEGEIEKRDIYTKEQLMTVLTEVYEDTDHIIIGEQSRGQPNCVRDAIKSFEGATGENPGIIGIEMQVFGMGIFANTERHQISRIICDIVDYVADGGIVTFSAHWENPSGNYPDEDNLYRGVLGYDNTRSGYEQAFTDLLTPGTEYNTKWMEEIDREVEFFLALQDNNVPAIWRPLHEANGNWFWFCTTQAGNTLDASYIKNIWYYIYDYFAEKGIENLLWCYAPSPSSNVDDNLGNSKMSTTYLYPGDEYCDIVGVDWYTEGELEIMESDSYLRLVDSSKKIGAITEFGPSGAAANEEGKADPEYYSSMNVYRDLLELQSEGYSFTYLMTWGGSWSFKLMGEGDKFMAEEMTLGQADVKSLFDALN
ncbi:MAG: hypothetical protein IJZ89_03705 [Clostridia bacterium]|nr:hypothetical protein [Clostridia bacterium]